MRLKWQPKPRKRIKSKIRCPVCRGRKYLGSVGGVKVRCGHCGGKGKLTSQEAGV